MSVRAIDGTGAPDYFDQGLPCATPVEINPDGGYLAVDTVSAIDHYHQGLPFTAVGRLATVVDAAIDHYGSGAAPFDAANRLITTAIAATDWIAAVGFSSGRVTTE